METTALPGAVSAPGYTLTGLQTLPRVTTETRCTIEGQLTVQAPAQTVLVFEIDGGWNVSGGPELLPVKVRHGGAYVVGFADGHVEMVRSPRLGQLRWEP